MNNRKLITADKLLLSIQKFCDKQGIDIDGNDEYKEYNRLVTEYSFNNRRINIDTTINGITALYNNLIRA